MLYIVSNLKAKLFGLMESAQQLYLHFALKVHIGALSQNRIHWAPTPPTPLQNCAFKINICIYPQRGQVRWPGPEGPKAPTLGRHVSACATILRLRALLYLRASHQCVRQYIVTSIERLGQVAGAVRARRARHQADTQVHALLYLGCVRFCIRLHTLLYQVACTTFLRKLVYCNFIKEVRLGGWGKTRKCVRYYTLVACATIIGSVRYLSARTSIL